MPPPPPPGGGGRSKAKAKVDHLIAIDRGSDDDPKPLPHWTLHDLRRTYATGLQRIGVKIEVIEALLNHISGTRAGIVGVYQRYHYQDEMRAAVGIWERHVQTILCVRKDDELTTATPHL